jgi:tetratricopeptide (TPR) repeat protein/tRNA A-37 threonylcarbamoyl transferase component Bud32
VGPRYRVLRPHAVGGLGEVSVAEDVELHREVALKEIKDEHAHHESSRQRFLLEAEITGGLEHPGVVPVYGLGVSPDGRPYYAMRFIKGETLGVAIERFHTGAAVAFDSLAFRQLLGRFIDVCQAVAYAHSRGVLHRDLKPGNIMLGKFGETLVVDWGLAKVVGRPGGAAAELLEELTLRPAVGSDGVGTLAGAAVGTPGFMSPEQARGLVEELGPATDVYSLGATLYMVLTNQPPFRGKVAEVLRQVQQGAWLLARQVNSAVPPALEAICRKAMALRPEDRYASALELAEDVEHWLADEPVAVYREPLGARLRRWLRKHPRRATAAAVLLVAAVVSLTVGTVLLERSNREARENFQLAQRQAKYLLTEASEDPLVDEPRMQELRRKLLLGILNSYHEFLQKRPGEPHARQLIAEAKRQLGEIYAQVGRMDEARPLVKQAVELAEELRQQAPADPDRRFGLAHAHHARANLRLQAGEPEGGKEEVGRAIELLERLRAEQPQNPRFLHLLARSYDLRATAAAQLGDTKSGLAYNQRVLGLGVLLLTNWFSNEGFRSGSIRPFWASSPYGEAAIVLLARAYTNQGILLNLAGRNAEAARVLQNAIGACQWLLERDPQIGRFRHGLALALLHAGHVQVEVGRPARAEPALREAYEQLRKLCQDDPLVPEYAATRLLAAGYLGEALFRNGRTTAAEGFLRKIEQGEDILAGRGKSCGLRAQQARLLHLLGSLQRETGDVARGLEISQQARAKLERVLEAAPGDPSLRSARLGNREELALCRFLKGDINRDQYSDELRSILAERRKLAGPRPTRAPRFQAELAASAALRARLLLEAGRPAEALACVDAVLPDHERFVKEEQERARKRAEANKVPAKPDRSTPETVWLVFLSVRAVEPEDLELRRQWALLLTHRSAALAGVGRGPEAAKAVRQAITITEGLLRGVDLRCPPTSGLAVWSFIAGELCRQEPCYLDDLACQLALASTLPGKAGLADPASQAVQALRDHIAHGFDNAYKVRTDPALAPLRRRPDFQKLLGDLQARVKTQEPT